MLVDRLINNIIKEDGKANFILSTIILIIYKKYCMTHNNEYKSPHLKKNLNSSDNIDYNDN